MLLSRTAFHAAIIHLSINPALIRASTPAAFSLGTSAHLLQTPSSRLYTILFPQCAPLHTQIRTMSIGPNSSTPESAQAQGLDESQPQDAQQPSERLALPSTESSGDSQQARKLDLSAEGGSSVTLDHLGPMVVNVDGTMSRISNWEQMAEIERKNTLRIIGKRNKQRLDALKAARGEE
jgi:hypothetical protein